MFLIQNLLLPITVVVYTSIYSPFAKEVGFGVESGSQSRKPKSELEKSQTLELE